MIVLSMLYALFINFDVGLDQTIPLWLFLILIGIMAAFGIAYLLLRYSKNAILLKSKIDNWRSSRAESKEQKTIAENLENQFYASQEEINKDAGFTVLPFNMKIKWQNRNDVKAVSGGEDKFWIVMRNNEDQSENFVKFVEAAIEKNLVYRTRRYLANMTRRAIELIMMQKIIKIEYEDALEYFDENIYKRDTNKFSHLSDLLEGLTDLDAKGLFIRAFLREIHDFGNRTYPKTGTKSIKDEIKDLSVFFAAIGRRKPGEHVNQIFEGKSLRVGVLFIAGSHDEKEILSFTENPKNSPYADEIREYLNKNIQSIYLFSRGKTYGGLAKSLIDFFNNDERVNLVYKIPFVDRERKTDALICLIRMRIPHN